MFLTLEDVTGVVNVIVWPALVERQRKELLVATLFGVYGTWQCEQNVRHLVECSQLATSHPRKHSLIEDVFIHKSWG